jgi:F420-non-reducing hydrogenase small subunit
VAADLKYDDVRGYPDGFIDLCLFNGAIRTSENEIALLRRKSKILVAFGSCAYEGCIPALANLTNKKTSSARLPDQRFLPIIRRGSTPASNHLPENDFTCPAFTRR